MDDRTFKTKFSLAIRLAGEHHELKWTSMYLPQAKKLEAELPDLLTASERAEGAFHRAVGAQAPVIDAADAAYKHWANTVRADVHGAELGGFLTDYGSVAGLDDALGKLTDALRGCIAAGPKHLPYAADGVKELTVKQTALDALLLATATEWKAFREAAAAKNAARAHAEELFKAIRRHLKADLPNDSEVRRLQESHPRATRKVTEPPAPHA